MRTHHLRRLRVTPARPGFMSIFAMCLSRCGLLEVGHLGEPGRAVLVASPSCPEVLESILYTGRGRLRRKGHSKASLHLQPSSSCQSAGSTPSCFVNRAPSCLGLGLALLHSALVLNTTFLTQGWCLLLCDSSEYPLILLSVPVTLGMKVQSPVQLRTGHTGQHLVLLCGKIDTLLE